MSLKIFYSKILELLVSSRPSRERMRKPSFLSSRMSMLNPFHLSTGIKEAVESIPASRHLWREFFSISGHDAHGAGFVLGNFRQWVQGVDGEEVGGGFGEMHRNEYHTGRRSLSHPSAQDDGAAAR